MLCAGKGRELAALLQRLCPKGTLPQVSGIPEALLPAALAEMGKYLGDDVAF